MRTKKIAICTKTPEGTRKAGERLGKLCSGVVGLEGDLGAGKTVFAAGMARALDIDEYITSPTFNIVNVYEKDGRVLNHMDAYRITDPLMLQDIGFDEMISDGHLTVVEWADMIADEVPGWDAYVKMTSTGPSGKRIIIIEADGSIINAFAKEA